MAGGEVAKLWRDEIKDRRLAAIICKNSRRQKRVIEEGISGPGRAYDKDRSKTANLGIVLDRGAIQRGTTMSEVTDDLSKVVEQFGLKYANVRDKASLVGTACLQPVDFSLEFEYRCPFQAECTR